MRIMEENRHRWEEIRRESERDRNREISKSDRGKNQFKAPTESESEVKK